MDSVAGAFQKSIIGNRWRAVNFIENHDIVREGRQLRIPRLADGSNPRSWYARSRSRLAMGAGLENGDKNMGDFLRFTRELVALRRRQPALRGEGLAIVHVHSQNRVLALQRWIEGVGRDVIVVYNLSETNWYNYQLGFPGPGRWVEVFNSDVYDNWVNPIVSGNGGGIEASGGPLHGLSSSASVTIPANGFVVFARDAG
jgi:1,4-alpha-glucan branching enzyme